MSGRHLGGSWEAPGRHPGHQEQPRAREAAWRQSVPKSLRFTVFEKKATVSRRRHELDLHVDGKFTATWRGRGPGADPADTPLATKTIRQNPTV